MHELWDKPDSLNAETVTNSQKHLELKIVQSSFRTQHASRVQHPSKQKETVFGRLESRDLPKHLGCLCYLVSQNRSLLSEESKKATDIAYFVLFAKLISSRKQLPYLQLWIPMKTSKSLKEEETGIEGPPDLPSTSSPAASQRAETF